MTQRQVIVRDAGHQALDELDAADIPALAYLTTAAANAPALSTGTLVLLSDVITALTALRASHNDLLAKLKASGLMVPD